MFAKILKGTSEGAKKAWATRRGKGGGGKAEPAPSKAAESSEPLHLVTGADLKKAYSGKGGTQSHDYTSSNIMKDLASGKVVGTLTKHHYLTPEGAKAARDKFLSDLGEEGYKALADDKKTGAVLMHDAKGKREVQVDGLGKNDKRFETRAYNHDSQSQQALSKGKSKANAKKEDLSKDDLEKGGKKEEQPKKFKMLRPSTKVDKAERESQARADAAGSIARMLGL